MLIPALLFLLLLLLALFGWVMLYYICARRDLPEGWEEERILSSGNAVWQEAYQTGRAWLERHESEEVEVQSDDGFLLHGLLIPHVAPRATVILFHGWRSSWEMDFTCILPFMYEQRLQMLLVDERAQGDSEGRYITFGVRERLDVPVWVDYVANRFGPKHPIFLQGLSMGATVVLMASSTHFNANVRGILADCGFTSPHEIISGIWRNRTPFPAHFAMWWLDLYTRLFADFKLKEYSTTEALAKTEYPVMFLHGTADKFVPSYMTKQSYEACASEKTLLLVDGATHGMSYLIDRPGVEAAYKAFIDKHLS